MCCRGWEAWPAAPSRHLTGRRTRAVLKPGSGHRLPRGKFQLSMRRILHRNGGQALEQLAQEAGKPPPHRLQASVGQNPERPELA